MRLLLALLVLLALPASGAAERVELASSDGTVLTADLTLPPGPGPFPVVVDAGPYYGLPQDERLGLPFTRGDAYARVGLAERGIALLSVDLRGFGGSGGCFSYHGADDRRDMDAVVRWAASRPWSTGRVALWGFSYDGGAALNAIAARPPGLVAAVLAAPVASGYDSLWRDGVHLDDTPTAAIFGPGLSAFDAAGPRTDAPPAEAARTAASADPACWADRTRGVEGADPTSEFWREREPAREIGSTEVPVLLSAGFADPALRLQPALDVLDGPLRTWLGQWPHAPANDESVFGDPAFIGRSGFQAEVDAFLDHHLLGRGPRPKGGAVVQEGTGGWRTERRWPPADARDLRVDLLPGSYRDAPGNSAEATDRAVATGRGSWTFTPPLEAPLHLAGTPRLALDATGPGANAIALLYDVAPDGTATLVSRGAARLPAAAVELHAQDWRVAAGHRLGLLLTGADDGFFRPGTTLGEVVVRGGTLTLPGLRAPRADDLEGGPGAGVTGRRPFVVDAATLAARTGGPPR